jgi:hypothetical protein
VGAASTYYYFVYVPAHRPVAETAYVLPPSIQVVDTPAEVRIGVGSLKGGERVEITNHTRNWAHIRTAYGLTGWVELKDLLDSQTYEGGQKILRELASLPAQAEGHTSGIVNLRLEPSRDAAQLGQLTENQKVQVFGRRLVERPAPAEQPSAAKVRDAWYVVRANGQAGWVLGRFITLDIPPALAPYAQGTNLVAWVVLNTVTDGDQSVPQYLAADRMGTQDVDFTHFRVFTWWVKNHHYVTAYVESNLKGFFPIRVAAQNGVPHFRLRLEDDQGEKYQKVYGLFDTITRPIGTVAGWESDAMPTVAESRHHKHARRLKK